MNDVDERIGGEAWSEDFFLTVCLILLPWRRWYCDQWVSAGPPLLLLEEGEIGRDRHMTQSEIA